MQGFRSFVENITEKYALKAVYTAGSAGSGKSFVSRQMFESLGFRNLNVDEVTELFSKISRERAWNIVDKRMGVWLHDFDPILIDGTGRIYSTITAQSDYLRNLGYDTYMVFVDVPKDLAWQRNISRSRVVPRNVFNDIYENVYKNLKKYKEYFRDDLIIIKNAHMENLYDLKSKAVNLISRSNPGSKRESVLARKRYLANAHLAGVTRIGY